VNLKDVPAPDIITGLYAKHYSGADRTGKEYSSHWRKYSGLCEVRIGSDGDIRARGCGFGDMYYRKPWHKAASALLIASYLRNMQSEREVRDLMRTASVIVRKMSACMSYDAFRQVCALSTLGKYVPFNREDAFDVLIIGDGYGFLSALVRYVYPRSRITLVDIGPILLFQTLNLQAVFPESSHALIPDCHKADFVYCEAEGMGSLGARSFDVCINISSMQEMTNEMIRTYFSLIRKTAHEHTIFYCCNRELKVLPGGERIEYSKYPWLDDDTILLDEVPEYYRYYYSHTYPFKRYFEPMRHRVVRMARPSATG